MASTAPTLLTLPREIRDHIYGYLHHELPPRPLGFIQKESWALHMSLQVEKSPLFNLLLVHSRIYAEYLESACFRDLSATIFAHGNFFADPTFRCFEEDFPKYASQTELAKTALRHTTHLTIHYDGLTPIDYDRLFSPRKIIEAFANGSSSLRSIRVAARDHIGVVPYRTALDAFIRPLPALVDFPSDSTLHGLPLIQHGLCCGLAFNKFSDSKVDFFLEVHRIVFDVYTTDKANSFLWDEGVVKVFKNCWYHYGDLTRFSEEQKEKLMQLPEQAFMWSAQRMDGDE